MTSLTTGDDRITLSHQPSGILRPGEKQVLLRTPHGLPLFTLPDNDPNGELYDPERIVQLKKDISCIQFIGVPTETNRLNESQVYPMSNVAIHIRGKTDIPNFVHCKTSSIVAGLPLQTVFYRLGTEYYWYVCASQDPAAEVANADWYCLCPMGRVLRATKRGIQKTGAEGLDVPVAANREAYQATEWKKEVMSIKSLVSAYITA